MIITIRETTTIGEVDRLSRGRDVPTVAEAEAEVVHQPTVRGVAIEATIEGTSLIGMLHRSHEA